MKKNLLFLLCLCFGGFTFAQNGFQTAWTIPFMSTSLASSITPTSDGGTISCLSSSSNSIKIIKTNSAGIIEWSKNISGPSTTYFTNRKVAQSVLGGYYSFSDYWDINSSQGYVISKFDVNGLLLWSKFYISPGPYEGVADIAETSTGDFIVSMGLDQQIQEFKTDANGNLLWTQAYREDQNYAYKEPGNGCAISSDGSVLLIGNDNDGASTSLIKTDATGNLQWTKVFPGSNNFYFPGDIVATSDGGNLYLGASQIGSFLMKMDNVGTILWTKSYTGNYISYRELNVLPNGNYLLSGSDYASQYNYCIIDPNGTVISDGSIGNSTNLTFLSTISCPMITGGFATIGNFSNNNNSMSGVAACRSNSNNTFDCQYYASPITVATMAAPTMLTVAINPVFAILTVQALTLVQSDITVVATDFCSIANVQSLSTEQTSVSSFPNPISSGENLSIVINGYDGNATISIYDVTGKLVSAEEKSVSNSPLEIKTTDFRNGIYLARILNDQNELIGTTKFLVR